jgi:ATP-dependent DNA helicase RecG
MRLRGVGKATEKHLSRLNISSVRDLLFHLPLRYQDRTQVEPIYQVIPGEEAVIEGTIHAVEKPLRGRTKLMCELRDTSGKIYLRFFHVMPFQLVTLKIGVRLRCYSMVRLSLKGLEMTHPEYQIITEGKLIPVEQHLTPIYPATEGLGQYTLRKLAVNALAWMQKESSFDELLPATLLKILSLPTFKEALMFVHQPPRDVTMTDLIENKTSSQKRLILEELLAHRLSLLHVKHLFQSQPGIPLSKEKEKISPLFLQQLPFHLTNAQKRVVDEIKIDLTRPHPMLRLIQGDVGSGKTVVAALAMVQAIENGFQAAMMAPTELLAEQHFRVFKNWLEPLGINVVFLSGNVKARARKLALQAIENGEAQVILGTHALFQKEVTFSKLALIIVDEQHRFGVHQRALFREKGLHSDHYPHQLIMTATPIPRTLAMSFYADLDCSIIDELPPGRTPVVTSVIASSRRDEVIDRIRGACVTGRQAYWVCPLIEESETLACQAAIKTAEQLQQLLPELKIELIHGRMNGNSKEAAMQAFQTGKAHVLVATSVIEVGVDVANASLMVIENAERLGLSQLHQLRGRVGRGSVESHCVLLYQHPLSQIARERLAVVRETTDGFKIAQRDLELRGPGEVLGTRQTGEVSFRIADLMRDSEMLSQVQQVATAVMRELPENVEPLIHRWLGEGKEYGRI